nr:MAG TPA_asm: hypothetical protein [Inoviridae sp.]
MNKLSFLSGLYTVLVFITPCVTVAYIYDNNIVVSPFTTSEQSASYAFLAVILFEILVHHLLVFLVNLKK